MGFAGAASSTHIRSTPLKIPAGSQNKISMAGVGERLCLISPQNSLTGKVSSHHAFKICTALPSSMLSSAQTKDSMIVSIPSGQMLFSMLKVTLCNLCHSPFVITMIELYGHFAAARYCTVDCWCFARSLIRQAMSRGFEATL